MLHIGPGGIPSSTPQLLAAFPPAPWLHNDCNHEPSNLHEALLINLSI